MSDSEVGTGPVQFSARIPESIERLTLKILSTIFFNTFEKSLIIFPKYQQEILTLSLTLRLNLHFNNSEGSIQLDAIKVNPHTPDRFTPSHARCTKHDLDIKTRIKNLRGVNKVRFENTRLFHLGNVEKPPHPQFLHNERVRLNLMNTKIGLYD